MYLLTVCSLERCIQHTPRDELITPRKSAGGVLTLGIPRRRATVRRRAPALDTARSPTLERTRLERCRHSTAVPRRRLSSRARAVAPPPTATRRRLAILPRQHPTAFAGEESESNLMARAGKIFAFGIVATVIILLGVVSSRVASPSRASLGVPHDGGRLSPAPRVLSGNDTLAASDPDPAREARVLTRQNLRTRRRKHRHWNRGDRDGVDDVNPATRAQRRDLPVSAGPNPTPASPSAVGFSSRIGSSPTTPTPSWTPPRASPRV